MIRTIAFAAVAALFTGCASQQDLDRARKEAEHFRNDRDELSRYLDELRAENARLSGQVRDLGSQVKDANWVKDQRAKLQDILGGLRRDTQDIDGVKWRQTAEGVVVEVQGEILFASGRSEVTEGGQGTLSRLVPSLTRDGKRLRVAGHTDSDPIKNSSWESNLHLSAARALAVAEFLVSAGVPADRVAIAGYGEHLPRVPNDSDANKAENRRVEILLVDQQ